MSKSNHPSWPELQTQANDEEVFFIEHYGEPGKV